VTLHVILILQEQRKKTLRAGNNWIGKMAQPVTIDYLHLRDLCSIEGLKDRNNAETTEEAHATFMNEYKKIFATKSNSRGTGKLSLKA
jgi:hypothetical protein